MIYDNKPLQMCEDVVFYNFGKEGAETEAYSVEFEDVENSTTKNILVYEAELEQVSFDNTTDVYGADPEITSTGKLVRRWYFNPQMRKYFMKKGEL
jgi:hypothetical protein